ncbi:hypothetical protein PBCVMA1E_547R, partial [Paramecium bursaria Chlorella virus MA1E]
AKWAQKWLEPGKSFAEASRRLGVR